MSAAHTSSCSPTASKVPVFHIWPQELAQSVFPTLLEPYLPHSNPLYNRILAPANTPDRHCLFGATIPATRNPLSLLNSSATANSAENLNASGASFTLLFSDRSRHSESQIWVFNPLTAEPAPLSAQQLALLTAHSQSLVRFLRDTPVPAAPGWPFSPVLRLACVHEIMAALLIEFAQAHHALVRSTDWRLWSVSLVKLASDTANVATSAQAASSLPPRFTLGTVPPSQLDIVLATSTLVRQAVTLLKLPNCALLDSEEKLVAWAYVGIDGSIATLYVMPEYRGRGFATLVARELLLGLGKGNFAVDVAQAENGRVIRGYGGESGWVHSDVQAGNAGSEGVMRSLGGTTEWQSRYISVDTSKIV
ncbi:MAG: hypothetical protein M1818_000211 [Claussenomyces sp. TS43310]|nr:MAG: hypothetical protein M1818_000211 [Claussenomyces sp. TS43310]